MRIALSAAVVAAALLGTIGTAEARQGCGPGYHRGYHGYCRPNVRPGSFFAVRSFHYGFYGYHPRPWYGRRWYR